MLLRRMMEWKEKERKKKKAIYMHFHEVITVTEELRVIVLVHSVG